MSLRPHAFIDLSALQHNIKRVREICGSRQILAMIKANGYGHGLLRAASALNTGKADALGVAVLEEALMLRNNGVCAPIILMSGFHSEHELQLLLQHQITPVIHHFEQINILKKTKNEKPLSAWIKVDTGMHRLGFLPQDFHKAYKQLLELSFINKPIVICTHLADADNCTDFKVTQEQYSLFKELTQPIHEPKSIANSAGVLSLAKEQLFEWVRPGIMLYGVSPFVEKTGEEFGLKPVMTLIAKLIVIKDLQKNDAIGYGGTWRCPENMRVGIAAIGYGDGYPRHAQSGTPVLIDGVECSVVGRVSMDLIAIDLRNQPHARIGSSVVLWGQDLPVERIARCSSTIAYELLCNIKGRVEFSERSKSEQ